MNNMALVRILRPASWSKVWTSFKAGVAVGNAPRYNNKQAKRLLLCGLGAILVTAKLVSPMEADQEVLDKISSLKEDQIVKVYEAMEARLLARLDDKSNQKGEEIEVIILALGSIRSKKAVPKLMEMIEFSNVVSKDPTIPTPRGGKYQKREDFYPALKALVEIGVNTEDCVTEILKSEPGSQREIILVNLGYSCNRKSFIEDVRKLSAAEDGDKDGRWKAIISRLRWDDPKKDK